MDPARATSPESYPFRREVDVRFRDLDSMGHAHHTLPLVYFEEARSALWREVNGAATSDDTGDVGYVLGEVSVRYHARIRYPARITVGVRLASIGTASFALEYAAWSDSGNLLASGRTTQVMYDIEREASVPVPDAVRRRLREVVGAVTPAAG